MYGGGYGGGRVGEDGDGGDDGDDEDDDEDDDDQDGDEDGAERRGKDTFADHQAAVAARLRDVLAAIADPIPAADVLPGLRRRRVRGGVRGRASTRVLVRVLVLEVLVQGQLLDARGREGVPVPVPVPVPGRVQLWVPMPASSRASSRTWTPGCCRLWRGWTGGGGTSGPR
jgi:hypothetical protein